jgi:hypothetical protein
MKIISNKYELDYFGNYKGTAVIDLEDDKLEDVIKKLEPRYFCDLEYTKPKMITEYNGVKGNYVLFQTWASRTD